MKLSLVTFAIIFGPLARGSDVLFCEGALPLFRGNGSYWYHVDSKVGRFKVTESNALFLMVGVDEHRPFLRIAPWGTPEIKAFPENYKNQLDIDYRVDGSNAFTIKMVGRKSHVQQVLSCVSQLETTKSGS
jgi:hypothetical protein